jgi:hypothetical protein
MPKASHNPQDRQGSQFPEGTFPESSLYLIANASSNSLALSQRLCSLPQGKWKYFWLP